MDRAGLRPVQIVFWNTVFTSFVEHVVMKLGEVVLGRSPVPNAGKPAQDTSLATGTLREIHARQRMRQRLERKGVVYYALQVITLLMECDLWLFGRMRCGNYFIVVEKPITRTEI